MAITVVKNNNARENARAAIGAALFAMMADVETFQRDVLDLPVKCGPLQPYRFAFKVDHLLEEITELKEAWDRDEFLQQVDALVDLMYVGMGALLEMGIEPGEAFALVHEKNMQKMRGETRRGESYDAVKPDGWTPPDHEAIVVKMRLLSEVRPALLEATRVVLERGAQYNGRAVRREDHFPFGMTSVFQMMWVKIMRMRADLEDGRKVNRDHLIDLINYAGFGVDVLDGRPM